LLMADEPFVILRITHRTLWVAVLVIIDDPLVLE
jgi:hypothetical protein